MKFKLSHLIIKIISLLLILFSTSAYATHFRGGQIKWTIPDPVAAPYTVRFTVQQAWREDFTECVNLTFGDTSSPEGCANNVLISSKTDDTGLGYKLFQYEVSHTYPSKAESYTAYFASCCRISTLSNGRDANFRVEAKLLVGGGKQAGPDGALSSLNVLQIGGLRTLPFSIVDPDGDPVTCRLATDAETGFAGSTPTVSGKLPTVTSSGNKCTISWDLTTAVVDKLYVLSLVLESTRNGKISSLAMDTMVITADGRAYGKCDASPLATIERANMLAGVAAIAQLQTIRQPVAAYNLYCRNGRFGAIRIPLSTAPTARDACASVQTNCVSQPEKSPLFCLPAGSLSQFELQQMESAASADLLSLVTIPKFKQLSDFVCEAK